MFKQVEEFNKTVIGIDRKLGHLLEQSEEDFLIGCLHEEIGEFQAATNLVDRVDALIDLIYFAVGGLSRLGVPAEKSEAIFNVVHTKNMSKKKGVKVEREIPNSTDAFKPEGWISPEAEIKAILEG
jgi:predicted HAD superfamily Cof-like phosphohydrolase